MTDKLECPVCHRWFTRPASKGRKPIFCSKVCRRLIEKVRAGLVSKYLGLVSERRELEVMVKLGNKWQPFGIPSRGSGSPADAVNEVEIELADTIERLEAIDNEPESTQEQPQ